MPDVEFVALGDMHLGGINNLFPNYDFDPNTMIFKAFNKALNYCREHTIEHVIIKGDVFDSPFPTQKSQQELLQWLIKNNQFKFYLVAGNHDYSDVDTISLGLAEFTTAISSDLKHVRWFSQPELVKIDGVPFSFLPWPHHKTLQNPSVNIAHIEVPGSQSDNGKVFKDGYKISPNGIWYIGHLHRKQVIKNAFFGGTLFQKTFGEPPEKGFYHSQVAYKNGRLEWDHDWIPIQPPYTLVNLKIIDPQDLKKVTAPDPKKIIQYRLLLKNGIELPPGYLETYPNVVDVSGKLSVKEIDELEKQNFSIDLQNDEISLLDGLDEFLKQEGLTEKQVERANKLLQPFLDEL